MLKFLGFILKVSAFTLVVLIVGNWLKWDGVTLSDQIKTHLSHAESSDVATTVRGWAGTLVNDAKKGSQGRAGLSRKANEELPASERQKLRSLIRELGGSAARD